MSGPFILALVSLEKQSSYPCHCHWIPPTLASCHLRPAVLQFPGPHRATPLWSLFPVTLLPNLVLCLLSLLSALGASEGLGSKLYVYRAGLQAHSVPTLTKSLPAAPLTESLD